MTDRIEEIRQREENATRGPWAWDGHRVPTLSGRAGDPDIYEYDTEVIEASHSGECACRSLCTLELEIGPWDRMFIANARDDIPFLLAEVERLTAANDRLARIASNVAVTLKEGKRDLMAHAWDRGYLDGRRQDAEGDDGPRFVNPYKEASDD